MSVLLLLALCLPTPAQPTVRTVDNPLDGRLISLSNGLVRAAVAPQLGGRLLDLSRAGALPLIKSDADYAQTTEHLYTSGGVAGLSWAPAEAWAGANDRLAAVRWRSLCELQGKRLQVDRELAVHHSSRAVYLRVRVTNLSEATVEDIGYRITPHFAAEAGTRLQTRDAALDTEALRDRATDLRADFVALATPDTEMGFLFTDVSYRVRGEGYMFRIEHDLWLGSIAPGKTVETSGGWLLVPPKADVGLGRFSWEDLPKLRRVEPLDVPDTPPTHLPRTPGAETYFGLCAGNTPPEGMPLWQAAGVKWVRLSFGWGAGEPEPGKHDFSRMDAQVQAAEEAGLQVIGLLLGNPGWATVDGGSLSPPRDYGALERYAEALAARYRGRVKVWEVWNEPDIGQFWTGTPEQYGEYLKAVYAGARRGNPECLVMSAGLDGPGERYLLSLAESGALEYCDLIGFHPYSGTPAGAERRIRAVWRIVNYYGLRRPVWVTEVGWQSGGWQSGPGVTDGEETKALYLAEVYRRLRPLCEVVCWYVDIEAGAMFGLARPEGSGLALTLAFEAYKTVSGVDERAPFDWRGPAEVTVEAGRTATLEFTLRNRTDASATPRVGVVPALSWATVAVDADELPPGAECTCRLTLTPPAYAVPQELRAHLVATVPGGTGSIATVVLELQNEGPSYAVQIQRRWAIALDAEGNKTGSWTPTNNLLTPPGGRMRQEVRIDNRGAADETFTLALSGTAAPWTTGFPREAEIAAGGEHWLGIDVTVPPGTQAGTYWLELTATSRRFPEVTAGMSYHIAVGRGAP